MTHTLFLSLSLSLSLLVSSLISFTFWFNRRYFAAIVLSMRFLENVFSILSDQIKSKIKYNNNQKRNQGNNSEGDKKWKRIMM